MSPASQLVTLSTSSFDHIPIVSDRHPTPNPFVDTPFPDFYEDEETRRVGAFAPDAPGGPPQVFLEYPNTGAVER